MQTPTKTTVAGYATVILALIAAYLFGTGEVGRPASAQGDARYQIASGHGQSCFVVDTRTGRLWHYGQRLDGGFGQTLVTEGE